ncbi:hypothetical protein [Microvirga calopogonii]|uniref:hypothetical protein n=1 Tax=Microvirga calopogonii TaxID=2078013 RepID=UPI000E0D5F7C|nr:hypothetical protein [Microvirga calopogonii]
MKKSALAFGLVTLSLAALTTSPVLARDPFAGGYEGTDSVCAKNVSCSFEIDPVAGGKSYTAVFEAEQQGRSPDGLITRKTLCKVTAQLTREGKRLKGAFPDGQPIEITQAGAATVAVSKSSTRPCGVPFSISGKYENIMDY